MPRPLRVALIVGLVFGALLPPRAGAKAQTIAYAIRFPSPDTHVAARYSGARGFKPEEFVATASEVAGTDRSALFHKLLATTDEIEYDETLDWFGLKFAEPGATDPSRAWSFMVRPDATPAQRAHLRNLVTSRSPQH